MNAGAKIVGNHVLASIICCALVGIEDTTCAGKSPRITDGLEERNLVKRVHSSQDRRVINIEITDEALKIYNKVGKMIKTIIGDSISSLPEDDVEKLSTILEKISQNMHCHS